MQLGKGLDARQPGGCPTRDHGPSVQQRAQATHAHVPVSEQWHLLPCTCSQCGCRAGQPALCAAAQQENSGMPSLSQMIADELNNSVARQKQKLSGVRVLRVKLDIGAHTHLALCAQLSMFSDLCFLHKAPCQSAPQHTYASHLPAPGHDCRLSCCKRLTAWAGESMSLVGGKKTLFVQRLHLSRDKAVERLHVCVAASETEE